MTPLSSAILMFLFVVSRADCGETHVNTQWPQLWLLVAVRKAELPGVCMHSLI